MADGSSFQIHITSIGSPSTVESNGSENTVMTRSRRAAQEQRQQEELRQGQELFQQQPPPLPVPALAPALTQQIDNTSAPQNRDRDNVTLAPQPILDIGNLMSEDGLNALSLSIRNNATSGMVVTDKQKKLITVSKQYKNAKENSWGWFFEIVIEHCGEALATLASTTITNPDGSEINALIQAIQGKKKQLKSKLSIIV